MTASANLDGYWGAITSTLDWCEENYTVSFYVAEFWNTVSNLAFIIPSLYGAYSAFAHGLELRFVLAHLGVVMIGTGSAMFHATLKRTTQLLDEIPMLFTTAVLLFIAMEIGTQNGTNIRGALALTFTTLIACAVYLATQNSTIFFTIYGSMVFALIFMCVRAFRSQDSVSGKLIKISMWSYFIGFLLWNFENNFCRYVRDTRSALGPSVGMLTHLHTWWHILAAVGGYWCIVFLAQLRMVATKRPYAISYSGGMLPVVVSSGPVLPVHSV